ncbi:PAS domain S-box protein [Arundinibacter roseus]|uniref:histidine kinase n=1 Tax=Arundinibacter roseus TaxID=2070510 RepID=A0A4R4KKR5_9BACT|nr:PAS domain S-box protein [Arundinibacter roseus]TDB68864.1 PAS domain S-box protein [Arundinibacter roseus]
MKDIFEFFYTHSTEGLIITDAEFRILGINPAAEDVFQIAGSTCIGSSLVQTIPFQCIDLTFENIFETLTLEGSWKGRVSHHLPNQTIQLLSCNFYQLRQELSEQTHYAFLFDLISDSKLLSASLLLQQEQYASFLKSLSEGITVQTETSDIILCNPAAERILGLTRDQMLGRSSVDPRWRCIHEDGSPFPGETHPSMVSLGTGLPQRNVVMGVYKPDGDLTWISINSEPIFDNNSAIPTAVITSFNDITELKSIEQSLKKTEERWNFALEGSGLGVWDWNIAKQEIYFSPHCRRILGFEHYELPDDIDTWRSRVHPDDLPVVKAQLIQYLKGQQERFEVEYRVRKKDESYTWVLDRGMVVDIDSNGMARRMIGTHADQQQRKQMEEAERQISQRFKAVFNSMYQFIGIMTPDGLLVDVNEAALAFAGITMQDVVGKPLWEAPWVSYSETIQTQIRQDIARAAKGEFIRHELEIAGKQNDSTIIDFSLKPVRDENGIVTLIIPEGRDIGALKHTEKLLQEANEALAKRAEDLSVSNAELERFAYVASHDLQEPLRTVTMFLELLDARYGAQLDTTGRTYIATVTRAANRMKTLIQDLLQYARIGNDNFTLKSVDSQALVTAVIESFGQTIQETGAKIIVRDLPRLHASETMLYMVFHNLVGNALKYKQGAEPIIEIGYRLEDAHYEFFIKDNGIGIHSNYFDKIFIIFQRLHKKEEYSGTGLGLALCKKIVERHRGTIRVESAPGQGSTFYFTIHKKIKRLH